MKIEGGEDATATTSWSEEIESKIAMVDEDVDRPAVFVTEAEQRETAEGVICRLQVASAGCRCRLQVTRRRLQ